MTTPVRAFFARPEQERCQAGYADVCTGDRNVRIHCEVEGADITVCHGCAHAWRQKSALNAMFINRCPRCAVWNPGEHPVRQATIVLETVLTGPVADAIDKAMHAEGMTIDRRIRVLQILARDAPWLETAAT